MEKKAAFHGRNRARIGRSAAAGKSNFQRNTRTRRTREAEASRALAGGEEGSLIDHCLKGFPVRADDRSRIAIARHRVFSEPAAATLELF